MLTDEQKARLNPEQLVIAEKWEREADLREEALKEMDAARAAKDFDAMQLATDKFFNIGGLLGEDNDRCEHDRSIMGTCAGCEELERLLHPEFYDANGDRLSDEDIEDSMMD